LKFSFSVNYRTTMKTKSEISNFLDQFYLLWMENKNMSFSEILNGVRKEFHKNSGLGRKFLEISDKEFLSLLREYQNSLRDE
jgi:hypothetical protein